jgi:hypothetical protein
MKHRRGSQRKRSRMRPRKTADALNRKARPGVPRRPGPATLYGQSQAALERDAHFRRCGVKISVRWSGTFSEVASVTQVRLQHNGEASRSRSGLNRPALDAIRGSLQP